MRELLIAAAVLALLGGCAGRTENRAARGSADGYPAAPFEAVWHLRVGLNVAALMCKGRGRTPGFGRLRSAAGADATALSSAVLGGLSDALGVAERALSAGGARCKRLAVRVASHTPWMAAAAVEFEARLGTLSLSAPRSVLVCNRTGAAERDFGRLRQLLAQQIASTVLWDSCMDAIAERRVRCVLEVGAGQALTRLWRERYPDIPARSVDEFRSAPAIARWVHSSLR